MTTFTWWKSGGGGEGNKVRPGDLRNARDLPCVNLTEQKCEMYVCIVHSVQAPEHARAHTVDQNAIQNRQIRKSGGQGAVAIELDIIKLN